MFFPDVSLEHPGLSVVDIDRDGWDDLFVAMQHSPCQLLRNRGDGTFENIARQTGLSRSVGSLAGDATCALFADFDNDGDSDVFIGHARNRCQYFVNEDGRFVNRSREQISTALPYLVSSISTADYDGDGLLDVYMATSSPIEELHRFQRQSNPSWARIFLSPDQLARFTSLIGDSHPYLNRPGPPNLLLRGIGGGSFEVAPENEQVEIWRKSTQAIWSDLDGDGDPDLYVANEYAPDVLLRNDANGFTDASSDAGLSSMGFGTGITMSDYDCDGRRDLYVSNISTRSGTRIRNRVDLIAEPFQQLTQGNSLYRNLGDVFENVARSEPDKSIVSDGGWSRGVQFIDINNDGYRDLYCANGYYTAPSDVAAKLDLSSNFWRSVIRSDDSLDTAIRNSLTWDVDRVSKRRDDELRRFEWPRLQKSRNSLGGHQRNRIFLNRDGQKFADISGISGADAKEDGRAVAVWDFDRDGMEDLALANANAPTLRLYHNQARRYTSARNASDHFVAIRFVGGNRQGTPSNDFGPRDGFGAQVILEFDNSPQLIQREYRGGEGYASQNSATMIIGLGNRTRINRLTVRWPSGKSNTAVDITGDQLLTVFEDIGQSGNETGIEEKPYLSDAAESHLAVAAPRPALPQELRRTVDTPIVTLTSMTTWSETMQLGEAQLLKDFFDRKNLTMLAVPVDPKDGEKEIQTYVRQNQPPFDLDANWTVQQRRVFQTDHHQSTRTNHSPGDDHCVVRW